MLPNQFQNIVDAKIWIIEQDPVLISVHPTSYDVETRKRSFTHVIAEVWDECNCTI